MEDQDQLKNADGGRMSMEVACGSKVLLVEDELPHATLMRRAFHKESPDDQLVVCSSAGAALAQLEQEVFDAVVLDYSLPDSDGLSLLRELLRLGLRLPVIVVTGRGDEKIAVEAMKLGASDYILKSENYARTLPLIVHKAIEAKNVERQLATAEARYRLLFEQAQDAIGIFDERMHFVELNPKCSDLSGYARDELLSLSVPDLLRSESAEPAGQLFARLKREGMLRIPECRVVEKTGGEIIVEVTAVALGGGMYQFIARDVTERKELEQQLIQSQKMDSIGKLASGIAHDFNNLLGAILGYASLLKADFPAESVEYSYMDVIESSARRGAELTRQLLTLGRHQKRRVKPVNLNQVVNEVVQLLARTIDKRIEIITRCPESLATVEGDAGALQQVILNLCLNARDAMRGGGKMVIETRNVFLDRAFVRTHVDLQPGPHVLLSVSDTGVGMDADTQLHLFEPFYTTKEEGEGTGLGLAMAYGIVKNHQGLIRVYSELGLGTSVQIYLPASGRREAETQPSFAEAGGGTEVILVVDDETAIRNLLSDTLTGAGYRVIKASNGAHALRLVEQSSEIDLIILDMVMPVMDGREAYQRIRQRRPSMRVLFSSGFNQQMTEELLNFPHTDFLQKPYLVHEVLAAVRRMLDQP